MLIEQGTLIGLSEFGHALGLVIPEKKSHQDKSAKMLQILAYLEAIHVHVNKYSKKRELLFVEAGAGNCYLSLMAYRYYAEVLRRPLRIYCIDRNAALMAKNEAIARDLGYDNIHFHAGDIGSFQADIRPDIVYALHACDLATDKALLLGLQSNARNILSVSCCQHSFRKSMKVPEPLRQMARHTVMREKLVHMTADMMRSMLMEMAGYKTSLVEMVSSRATEKNVMLRSEKISLPAKTESIDAYLAMRRDWCAAPALESYMLEAGLLPSGIVEAVRS